MLAFYLYDEEVAQNEIPKSSTTAEIELKDGEFVNYIACDTIEYAKMHNNRAVKKTLTIPEWLNEAATRAGVNYSQALQRSVNRVN